MLKFLPKKAQDFMIDLEKTKNLLHYEKETGVFRWEVNRGGFALARNAEDGK